jgi:hypothetical protein
MSGTLPQYRPASKPLVIGGETIYRQPTPDTWPALDPAIKRTLKPGGVYRNGRCVEWTVRLDLKPVHVLTPRVEAQRTSKHARGRIRPRTADEQRRAERRRARFAQIMKTYTIDAQRMAAGLAG